LPLQSSVPTFFATSTRHWAHLI